MSVTQHPDAEGVVRLLVSRNVDLKVLMFNIRRGD